MRFLIDEALQDAVADELTDVGHDATHVRTLGLGGATDEQVMERARDEDRLLVTTDTDVGRILALAGADGPSVLLLRGVGDTAGDRLAALLRSFPSSKVNSPPERWSWSKTTATAYARCPSTDLRPPGCRPRTDLSGCNTFRNQETIGSGQRLRMDNAS